MSAQRKVSIGCGLAVLFGLGVVTGLVVAVFTIGGLAKRADSWNTEASREFITNHLAGVMKLDEEQKAKLAPLVDEAFRERWDLRQAYRRETNQLFTEKYWPRVQEFTSEEQQARLRERWSKWRREKKLDPDDRAAPTEGGNE